MRTKQTRRILDDAAGGHRLTEGEALTLLKAKGRDILEIASAADLMREKKVGNKVTYVRNQNLHITNICKNLCGFCGFGRPPGAEGTFLENKVSIQRKAGIAKERNVTEVCILSGVHPDFTLQSYLDIISWIREIIPGVDIHTGSPDEIMHAAGRSGISTREVILAMQNAGMGTLQGTAAEILVDSVRNTICPRKINTETWISIIKEAHMLGLKSTATIMYGSAESEEDRITHLGILREIQDETGGFTELVPLSYLHQNTSLYRRGLAPAGATGREDLLMVAVSRLFLDNFENIQISWGKVGKKMAQLGLLAGGNDLGGTMFCDDVTSEAGGKDADYIDPREMKRLCDDIGRLLMQRTTTYESIRGSSQ